MPSLDFHAYWNSSVLLSSSACVRAGQSRALWLGQVGYVCDILSPSTPVTPSYFRYIVLDLSGSIAYSNQATINLKLGIRSFFQERRKNCRYRDRRWAGADTWDASRRNWSGGLVRTPEPNLDWLNTARAKAASYGTSVGLAEAGKCTLCRKQTV
jgi:hypothetical protein